MSSCELSCIVSASAYITLHSPGNTYMWAKSWQHDDFCTSETEQCMEHNAAYCCTQRPSHGTAGLSMPAPPCKQGYANHSNVFQLNQHSASAYGGLRNWDSRSSPAESRACGLQRPAEDVCGARRQLPCCCNCSQHARVRGAQRLQVHGQALAHAGRAGALQQPRLQRIQQRRLRMRFRVTF